jgi:hypothetical protein
MDRLRLRGSHVRPDNFTDAFLHFCGDALEKRTRDQVIRRREKIVRHNDSGNDDVRLWGNITV